MSSSRNATRPLFIWTFPLLFCVAMGHPHSTTSKSSFARLEEDTFDQATQATVTQTLAEFVIESVGAVDPNLIDNVLVKLRIKRMTGIEFTVAEPSFKHLKERFTYENIVMRYLPNQLRNGKDAILNQQLGNIEEKKALAVLSSKIRKHKYRRHVLKTFVNEVKDILVTHPPVMCFLRKLYLKLKEKSENKPITKADWRAALVDASTPKLSSALDRNSTTTRFTKAGDATYILRETIHMMIVMDFLTENMRFEPLLFLRPLLDFWRDEVKTLDLTDTALFWQVKYPSVLKPLTEFVSTSERVNRVVEETTATRILESIDNDVIDNDVIAAIETDSSALLPKGRVGQGRVFKTPVNVKVRPHHNNTSLFEEDEDDDDDVPVGLNHYKGKFLLKVMDSVIDKDPTEALRKNILEACIGEMVVLFDYPPAFSDDLPGGAKAGFVIANDRMYGSIPKAQGGQGYVEKEHATLYSNARFTFTDSHKWMILYSAWNMGFTLNTGMVGRWWAKLLLPAVIGNPAVRDAKNHNAKVQDVQAGEEYIVRRAIALYLMLVLAAFENDRKISHGHRDEVPYTINVDPGTVNDFGECNWEYAQDYMKLWDSEGTECPECKLGYEKEREKWIGLARSAHGVSEFVNKLKGKGANAVASAFETLDVDGDGELNLNNFTALLDRNGDGDVNIKNLTSISKFGKNENRSNNKSIKRRRID